MRAICEREVPPVASRLPLACDRKYKYGNEKAAQVALRDWKKALRSRGGQSRSEINRLSVYQCHDCGLWHLGRRPTKEMKAAKMEIRRLANEMREVGV